MKPDKKLLTRKAKHLHYNWIDLCSITVAMSGPAPPVSPALSADEWLRLLKEMERFANSQLQQHRWRGRLGGVLPDGFDAPSVASEVIAEYFNLLHSRDSSAHQLIDSTMLQTNLHRPVRRAVDRLRRRKENLLLSNEPDFPSLVLPDGHALSPVEARLSEDLSPDQLLIQKEDNHLRTELQHKFFRSLDAYPALQQFFKTLVAAEVHPQPQHPHLNLSSRALDNFRKRLRRRFRSFSPAPDPIEPAK